MLGKLHSPHDLPESIGKGAAPDFDKPRIELNWTTDVPESVNREKRGNPPVPKGVASKHAVGGQVLAEGNGEKGLLVASAKLRDRASQ
jgi:hypothetical protein